ncbi:P-loop NTPase fold protein [Kribbella sp. NPDC051586]|uniref:KAP family P-loop NTPase fold protein n=1 Tax=Kribbella sp. NPDC051586 TaxID=3364118 RepID=UPI0037A440D4
MIAQLIWSEGATVVLGDNPIRRTEDDVLGRAGLSRSIADDLLEVDASDGHVVAILGAWGSGKTSLINLIKLELDSSSVPIIDFNPWMFSGTEQLVESFFGELAAQLRLKGDKVSGIAKELESYGEIFSPISLIPVVGGWFDRARGVVTSVRKLQEKNRGSVVERRAKLGGHLRELKSPIIVFIDDIDRLQTTEIRDIFRLVRLTASFPNIVYVLAFDRSRVESALQDQGVDGRSYLEKIVQTLYNLPRIPDSVLWREVGAALTVSLKNVEQVQRFDEDRWLDILAEVIVPLMANMRDVRRYAASSRRTVSALVEQVELSDLLAMEAVRVFLPDVFRLMSENATALTRTASWGSSNDPAEEEHRRAIAAMIEAGEDRQDVVQSVLRRLFPAALRHIGEGAYGADWASTWLRGRNVAHPDILRLYVENVAPEGLLAFSDSERAARLMANADDFESYLRSIDPSRLEDVVAALENWEDEYPGSAIVPASSVLLNIIPEMPEGRRGMFSSPDRRFAVSRVVLRLLRRSGDHSATESAAEEIYSGLHSLSSKREFLRIVGRGKNEEKERITSVDFERKMEKRLFEEIAQSSTSDLGSEWDVMRLVLFAKEVAGEDGFQLSLDDVDLNEKLLRAACSEVRGQSMGSRAVVRINRLTWDALIEALESEERIALLLDTLRERAEIDPSLKELVLLADKYLSGWRPEDF